MSIAESVQQDMKSALRAGDKLTLGILRMALAAIRLKEKEQEGVISDGTVLPLIEKMIKQGRDARQQFESGGRDELAAKEAAEIEVLKRYLPQPLSDQEVNILIAATIADSGASSIRDMGKVMSAIKAEAQGKVDMASVSARVREILTGE